MKTENVGALNSRSPVDTSFQSGDRDGTGRARSQSSESRHSAVEVAVPKADVFEEASSNLSRSRAQSVATDESKRRTSSSGSSDASSNWSREILVDSPDPRDEESGLPAVHIPADFRTAITRLVADDESSRESSSDRSISGRVIMHGANRAESSDALSSVETTASDRPGAAGTEDAVISLSSRAASALAAGTAMVPFGAVALGGASNLADFLAPAVVDGIKEPLSRSIAAAGFSGVFLGLTASVTTAVGNDIAQQITENRITPKALDDDASRGAHLWSAVKNQTIPAFIGFATAFATANALDAETGKLGKTDLNLETALLKTARATAGAVGLGLAAEAAKTVFSDHSLTKTEANRVFDNTRSLGEAIKRNVTSLPQAVSAYTRPTEKGGPTEFGNVLGAAFGFATFAAVYGVVSNALQSNYGEKTGERLSEPDAQAAIATAAGVAGFVIADQLARNIYANVMPVRDASGSDPADTDRDGTRLRRSQSESPEILA